MFKRFCLKYQISYEALENDEYQYLREMKTNISHFSVFPFFIS